MSRRGRATVVVTLGVMTVAVWAAVIGCGRDTKTVHASGMLEMDEIDVSSMVGGRLTRLYAGEGDSVHAGDTLAVLDRDEVAAQLGVQAAEAERAAAQSRQVTAGPRVQEIRIARATLASAQAAYDLAEKDFERTDALYKRQVAATAELDRARTARDEAKAKRDAANQQLRLLEAGSRREEIVAARQSAAAARASVAAAASRLRELVLVAPVSGVVLLRNYEPGELVPPNLPVLTLGNPDSLWIRAYVPAPQITRIRRGSAATVHLSGDKRTFPGRVIEIATQAEFTPRAALTEEERANIVFAVKIVLDPSDGALKAGVPADAVIEATPARP